MNTEQIINIFKSDPHISKFQFYCLPSDFLHDIPNETNTVIIVNSATSDVKNGHWLCIYPQKECTEFFDPLGFSYTLYTPDIKKFLEDRRVRIVQNSKQVQDYSTKSCGFHAILYFIFRCRGYSFKEFLHIYSDLPVYNDFLVENILTYMYNVDFSALRLDCNKKFCKFIY